MVQHAAQRIACLSGCIAHRRLDGFADRNAEAAGRVRILFENIPPGLGFGAGAGHTFPAPRFHHRLAVWFLIKTDTDHVDPAFHAELSAGERQRAPPLAGAGFSRHALNAENFVVIHLGDRRVRFVASRRADAFVLEIDPCRGVERFFKSHRPHERGGTPDGIDRQDLFRDVDPSIRADLLLDQVHRKHRCQHIRRYRITVRPQRGIHFDVGKNIVPLPRDFGFAKNDLSGHHVFLLFILTVPMLRHEASIFDASPN